MRPPSAAAVTIDGQPAQRQGEWFRGEFDAPNQSSAVYPTNIVQVVEGGVTNTAAVTTFVPPETLAYQHDADGNLTRDARWDYKWDAENRLLRVSTRADLPPAVPRVTTAFTYDPAGRRIRKLVTDAAGATVSDLRYLWHQNHLLMEVNGQNLALRTYQWGPDISGTFDGAAGAGGLYNINGLSGDNGPLWSDYANILPAHDGRGNLIGLGNRNDGALWAQFEYDPYGRTVSEKYYPGASAHVPKIHLRYNTRLTDRETGLVSYRFRHYSPHLGRWLNRDPIGEAGGLNLFGMVGNDPVNQVDPLGLAEVFTGMTLERLPDGTVVQTHTTYHDPESGRTSTCRSPCGAELGIESPPPPLVHFAPPRSEFRESTGPRRIMPPPRNWNQQEAYVASQVLGGLGSGVKAIDSLGNPNPIGMEMAQVASETLVYGAAGEMGGAVLLPEVRVAALAWREGHSMSRARAICEIAGEMRTGPIMTSARVASEEVAVAAKGLSTGTDEAVFWSGIGRDGAGRASGWAAQHGGTTLESTLVSRSIALPAWDASNPAVVAAWRKASIDFAAGARGNVRVLQGDALRVDAIWGDEFRALQANPNVNSIRAINPDTGAEVLLWSR